ncbi:MAG TPA: hypothetical protein DDX54_05965 [Rhodospirillaceae bacterium]|jgi:hypothetical protein|nr:hypothetical protein [Alphaproteobacteria bacterium]HBH26930.1 hypothetical protein [Rhodospirillaceae bacterium]
MPARLLSTWPEAEAEAAARALVLAGLYVAEAEDAPGEADDAAEDAGLRRALADVEKGTWTQALVVAEIARRALDARGEWPEWQTRAFTAPDEIAKATAALRAQGADKTERRAWRAAVGHIARTVGRAAGEHDALLDDHKKPGLFARLLGAGRAAAPSAAHVSPGEAAAIARLLEAVGSEDA